MSATLPNLSDFAVWLDGIIYEKAFRPVELVEHVKVADFLYDKEGNIQRQYLSRNKLDPDHVHR